MFDLFQNTVWKVICDSNVSGKRTKMRGEERRGEMRIHERESKLQSGVGGEKKKGDRMENVVQRTPCTLRMLKLLFTRYITCHYRTFMKGDDPDV